MKTKTFLFSLMAIIFSGSCFTACKPHTETPSELPYIALTTSKTVGDKMQLIIKGKNCFIDLNGNAKKDAGEEIADYSEAPSIFNIQSKTFKIYGDVATFNCRSQKISALDVTHCKNMEILTCNENELTTLDLSKNTLLIELYCGDNQLNTLNVTNNTLLTVLICNNIGLKTLDVSKNTRLNTLGCAVNQIKCSEMTNLLSSLPERTLADKAIIGIISAISPDEKNIATKADVLIAKNKKWNVFEVMSQKEYTGLSLQEIKISTIQAAEAAMSTNPIPLSDESGIKCKEGDIFLYKTQKGKFGKMEIQSIDKTDNYKLKLQVMTYVGANGIEFTFANGLLVRGTYPCELDYPAEEITDFALFDQADFSNQRKTATNTNLKPENGAKFVKYPF